ncbi:MAG: hypothetical protein ABSG25_07865 [Bryobacteraceae bacterium]
MSDITILKNIGMMQNVFMFDVNIPSLPYLGTSNLRFLVRTASIPAKTRNNTTIRYQGQQYVLPGAISYDPTFTCEVLMNETHDVYDILNRWFDLVTQYATGNLINTVKTTIQLKLLSVNKNITTKRFELIGAYPTVKPELTNLAMETTEGFITTSMNFSFDDLNTDEQNLLRF